MNLKKLNDQVSVDECNLKYCPHWRLRIRRLSPKTATIVAIVDRTLKLPSGICISAYRDDHLQQSILSFCGFFPWSRLMRLSVCHVCSFFPDAGRDTWKLWCSFDVKIETRACRDHDVTIKLMSVCIETRWLMSAAAYSDLRYISRLLRRLTVKVGELRVVYRWSAAVVNSRLHMQFEFAKWNN